AAEALLDLLLEPAHLLDAFADLLLALGQWPVQQFGEGVVQLLLLFAGRPVVARLVYRFLKTLERLLNLTRLHDAPAVTRRQEITDDRSKKEQGHGQRSSDSGCNERSATNANREPVGDVDRADVMLNVRLKRVGDRRRRLRLQQQPCGDPLAQRETLV